MKRNRMRDSSAPIEHVSARAYRIPTDQPESDGTLEWSSTTLIVAYVDGGGRRGFGYTYADTAAARLIEDKLATQLHGHDEQLGDWVAAGMRCVKMKIGRHPEGS